MSKTEIAWTDATWNPVRGCQRVSPGCGGGVTGPGGERGGCYAETMAARIVRMGGYEWIDGAWRDDPRKVRNPTARAQADKYRDLVRISKSGEARWTGRFAFDAAKLSEPIRRKTPTMYFVNSMSDLFGEGLTNEQIAAIFGVMAACQQHAFQVLTKRADRMVEWFTWLASQGHPHTPAERCRSHAMTACGPRSDLLGWDERWPLPNVWLGVSCEWQEEADERIPLLLQCPAAVRWVSAEPLLGPVNLLRYLHKHPPVDGGAERLSWVVWGGESGHGARPCAVDWIRDGVAQCRATGVPPFVKQIGSYATWSGSSPAGGRWPSKVEARMEDINFATGLGFRAHLADKKGADPSEWPEDLRVREWPHGFAPPVSPKRLPVVETP